MAGRIYLTTRTLSYSPLNSKFGCENGIICDRAGFCAGGRNLIAGERKLAAHLPDVPAARYAVARDADFAHIFDELVIVVRFCDVGFSEAEIAFVDLPFNDGFHHKLSGRAKTIDLGDVPRDARPGLEKFAVKFDLRPVRLRIFIEPRPKSGE